MESEPVYELLGWDHGTIPDSEEDSRFDVDSQGWEVVLSPRVPKRRLIVSPRFHAFLSTLPTLVPSCRRPSDFNWAVNTGGAIISSGVERVLNMTSEQHLHQHGNSSSTSIFFVLDGLRTKGMD
ncbi:hypothetical protein B7494_g4165 [Chlorociboria aeruginascens]|nr:hypothetical protein B7494_g4165 [Chlorociboria aeruginascens]